MRARRGQFVAWFILIACLALAGWRLATFDYRTRISTDVLDLIPGGETAPELALVRSLASEKQARVVLFSLQPGDDAGEQPERFEEAAAAFIASLRSAGVFAEVLSLSEPQQRESIGAYVFKNRMHLLLPQWLSDHAAFLPGADPEGRSSKALAEAIVEELDQFLQTPEASAYEQIIPADPLLLIPRLVETLPASATEALGGAPQEGTLVWAELKDSPLHEEAQLQLFAAVDTATKALRAIDSAAELEWTSVARFAAASRARIKAEVGSLNIASLIAVLVVTAILLRRIRDVFHLLPVLVFATAGAWCFTLTLFERLPVMVLIVGSLLAGVAIDYGFHLFGRSSAEEKLGTLLRPLLASALTTIAGFSALWFSELPVIRAIGVFVATGLACALAGALLWYFCTGGVRISTRRAATWSPVAAFSPHLARPFAFAVLGLLALIAILGPWRLRWHDDIRELDIAAGELAAIDASVRARFGESRDSHIQLSVGETPAAAREALEEFSAWVRAKNPSVAVSSLGLALPTAEAWRAFPARIDRIEDLDTELHAALEAGSYEAEAFAPFFEAWRELRADSRTISYEALLEGFSRVLRGPAGMALQVERPPFWFISFVESVEPVEPPPGTSTIALNQLATLNRVFSDYREATLRISVWGALVAAVVVVLFSGPRRAIVILLIPAFACLFTLGCFGLAGVTINLFHLLATLLAACLCFDYAIFASEHARRRQSPPPSIRLAGLTTAASFIVLAFSAIPVVSALGATVAISVLVTLAVLELLPALARPRAGRR
ncbi:MAG: hypothetical protein ACREIA_04740 [Opitutaceae bacterium]